MFTFLLCLMLHVLQWIIRFKALNNLLKLVLLFCTYKLVQYSYSRKNILFSHMVIHNKYTKLKCYERSV